MRKLAVFLLFGRLIRSNLAKFMGLTVLLALCLLIFSGMSALSRASVDALDASLSRDLGTAGMYQVSFPVGVRLSKGDVANAHTALRAATAFTWRDVSSGYTFDAVPVGCPGSDTEGVHTVFVAAEESATAQGARETCLAGFVTAGTRAADEGEQWLYGRGSIVASPDLLELVGGVSPQSGRLDWFGLASSSERDGTDLAPEIDRALTEELRLSLLSIGLDPAEAIDVSKAYSGADSRRAAQGVQLVYAVIGWGTLLLGGFGVLLSQMMMIRDRGWFFALCRSLGYGRHNIAGWVAMEVMSTVVSGLLLAVVLGSVTRDSVGAFSSSALGTSVVMFDPEDWRGLVVALVALGLIGGGVPAVIAARRDPIDILESGR